MPSDPKEFLPQNDWQRRLGQPTLTTTHAIAQSLAIGPIFSAVFLGALIAGAAGSVAPLSVLIAAIGSLGIGWVITLYARKFFGAGGIYEYLRLGANPAVGLFGGLIYFCGFQVQVATAFIVLGVVITQFVINLTGVTLSWWLCGLVMAIVVFALNHRGVRVSANVQLILSILSVIPLLILAIAIIAKGGAAGNTLQVFNPATSSSSAIFNGILFAITLFMGFEASASLGEETKDPQRSIPIAVMTVVGISAVFYLIVLYASDIGFGLANSAKWAGDSSPLATLATQYVGKWLATLIDLALVFDSFALAMAYSVTVSRGWFAFARHGLLPDILTKQAKHGTPLGGNILALIFAFIFTSLPQLFSADPLTFWGTTVGIGAILIELVYIMLTIFAAKILVKDKAAWWKWVLLILAFLTPLLGLKGSVWPLPPYPQVISVYVSIPLIIIVLIWTAVLSSRGKIGQAAHHYEWDKVV